MGFDVTKIEAEIDLNHSSTGKEKGTDVTNN